MDSTRDVDPNAQRKSGTQKYALVKNNQHALVVAFL
jgi:hypothetical protein